MTANYVLIDFENVQPRSLDRLRGLDFNAIVFVGANQTKISVELARSLQEFGHNARYVQISGNGRNALDFHIAYVLGELTTAEKSATYYIISRDTGFDPLVRYLKAQGIEVHRLKQISAIPHINGVDAPPSESRVEAVARKLKARGGSRPRKVRTLRNTINDMCSKSLKSDEVTSIMQSLVDSGQISTEGESVSYHFRDVPRLAFPPDDEEG